MNTHIRIAIAVCLCSGMLYGQTRDKPTSIWDQATSRVQSGDQNGKQDAGTRVTGIPMEGSIDPARYVLGPYDIFTLAFWGVPPLEYTVPVTPEGTILIPTVGEVRVADMSLSAARKRVMEAVDKKYRPGSFSMTLIRPRSLIVTLRGAVSRSGQYVATAVDRVERVLLEGSSDVMTPNTTFSIPAFSPSGFPLVQEDLRVPKISKRTELDEQTSTRNIKLIRRNGDTLHVDIPKYYATLDDRYNPFLLDGDLILVPNKTLSTNSVSVHGAVNAPGRYEYVEGDSLFGLIGITQGVLATADRNAVLVYRSDRTTDRSEEIVVDLDAIIKGISPDVPLQRGDRVLVRHQVDRRGDFYVTIGGEVVSPGDYPVTRESTKLSQIIHAAGGVTKRALLNSAIIWRKYEKYAIPGVPQLEYLRFLRAHQFDLVDSAYFFLDLKAGRQPVVVDFQKLLANNDTTQDIALRHEDFIYIPSNQHSVLVQGQVAKPGYIAYVPGADYRYYVQKAGDYQEFADEGEVRIIKGATMSWFKPGDTIIESGDQIFVPKESKKTFPYYFSYFRDIVGTAAAVATVILLFRR